MTAVPIRLLLLEDNPGDARLVQEALADQAPGEFAITTAERLADALTRIQSERFDAVLCDLGLPDSVGLDTAQAIVAHAPVLPLVVLTGSNNMALGRAAIEIGAQDYLVKGDIKPPMISRTIRYAIERKRLENELRLANETLERRVAERTAALTAASDSMRESEERYRLLFENSLDAILLTAPDGNILAANDAACLMFERTEEDIKQVGRSALTDASDPRLASALEERGRTGMFVGELTLMRKGGAKFPGDVSTAVFKDKDGLDRTSMIIRDISERKHAQEAVLRERNFNNATLESLPGLFYLFDEQGRFLRWNRNFEVVSGYTPEEISRLSPMDFFTEPDKEIIAGKIRQVFLTGAASAEADFVAKDRTRTPYFFNGRRVQIDQKPCLIGMGVDITERKLADAKLRRQTQLYAALSECNKAVVHCTTEEELFSKICHAAVHSGGMKMAWIGVVDPDTRMVRIASRLGERADEYLQGIEISVDGDSPLGRGPTGIAVRENQPVWRQEYQDYPLTQPWHERRARFGWGASASLPLRRNGVPMGVLTLYAAEVNGFDDATRSLLVEMATDVSFALDNFARESQRRRAEKELLAAEERFRGLVEQSIAGIYVVQDDKFVYVNPRLAEIFGYGSAEEIIGGSPLSVVAEKDRETVAESIRRRIEGEVATVSYQFTGLRRDGSTIEIGVHGARATRDGRPAVIGLMQDISEKQRAEEEIRTYVEQLKTAFMRTVEVATIISEMRDPYTAGHERRVAEIAVAIGAELGFDARQQEGLRVAGYLHDIGKMTIPSEILSKPGKLSAIEFQLVKGHAQASYDVLKGVDFPWQVAQIALQHHERMDGSGYPQGLKGGAILLEARILAVADVIEAMSSHRPYRPGLGVAAALSEIERGRGTAYDADVADACLRLFREKGYTIPV